MQSSKSSSVWLHIVLKNDLLKCNEYDDKIHLDSVGTKNLFIKMSALFIKNNYLQMYVYLQTVGIIPS